jgi:hypothetical protein
MGGNRRFSKPIAMREGPAIRTLVDALHFLDTLPAEDVTAPIYYARTVVDEALRSGRSRDVENARLELERALRAGGRL